MKGGIHKVQRCMDKHARSVLFIASLLLVAIVAMGGALPTKLSAAPSVPPPVGCAQAEQQSAGYATPSPALAGQIADMQKLVARHHDPGVVEYTLAELYARAKRYCDALRYLKKVVALHQGWDPSNDPLFAAMNRIGDYQAIVQKLAAEYPAVHRSAVVFTVHDPEMVPENVSFDEAATTWYVSSIYRRGVVRVDGAGRVRDFLRPYQYGLWEAIGMRIDRMTNSLWLCTAAENETPQTNGSSALLNVDVRSGRLLHKYVIGGGKTRHLFNDLVLDHNGNIYISDSYANTLYWLPAATRKLQVLVPGYTRDFPNGIDLDPTQRYLYVAYFNGGVDVVDLRTKKYRTLSHPPNVTLEGIDGLYYYRGSLIGVQSIGTERVARFYLDSSGSRVVSEQTLEYRNPIFQQPTEGTIVGSTLYYVANSQNFYVAANGKLRPEHTFADPVVLKLDL